MSFQSITIMVLLLSVTVSACTKQGPAIQPGNPACAIVHYRLSPDGRTILALSSPKVTSDLLLDLGFLLPGLKLRSHRPGMTMLLIDSSSGQVKKNISLKSGQEPLFVGNDVRYFYVRDISQNALASSGQGICGTHSVVEFPQSIAMQKMPYCENYRGWPVFDNASKHLANKILDASVRMTVAYGADGSAAMLVARDIFNRPIGVISKVAAAPIIDPDDISFVAPTELVDGSLGFWTDTAEPGANGDISLYRERPDGHFALVTSVASRFQDLILTHRPGRRLDRLLPIHALSTQRRVTSSGAAYYDVLSRLRTVSQTTNGLMYTKEDGLGVATTYFREPSGGLKRVWKCDRRRSSRQSLVLLPTAHFGPIWASLFNNDGGPRPMAIVLHGGPAGNRNNIEIASIEDMSSMGFALSSAGFRMLAPNYPGSGSGSRAFRRMLEQHAGTSADQTVNSAIRWIRTATNDRQYRPVIAGTSYGAYMAASALVGGVPASGYIFASGVYDPATQFGASSLRGPFMQGRAYASPYRDILAASQKRAYPNILILASRDDRVVAPRQSIIWAQRLKEAGYEPTMIVNQTGGHGMAPFAMIRNDTARAMLQSLATAAGPTTIAVGKVVPR